MLIKTWALLIFAVLLTVVAFSSIGLPCQLNADFQSNNLTACSYVLDDIDEKYTPEEAYELLKSNHFTAAKELESPNRNNHWLSFSCIQHFTKELLVNIKFSDLRGVWLIKNDALVPIEFAGYLPEYDEHYFTVFKDNHRFVYPLPQGDTVRFLCKTFPKYYERGSAEPFIYDVRLYEQQEQGKIALSTFFNGFILGMMIIFLIIAILVYAFFRNKAYLAYILYLVFVISYIWRDFEYLNMYFFSTMKYVPWHQTKLIMNCLVGVSYVFFIKFFMNTKADFPKVNKILDVLMWMLILVVPVDYIGSEWLELWSYRLGLYYAGGVVLITQLYYNMYFIRSPDPMARYIVYGTFFLAIGAISIPLLHVDIHTWVVRICFILEMIFFTAALSQNIKKVRQAKTKAEDDLKEAKIRHEYETEIKVSQERALTTETIRNEIARDIHDEIGAELTKISLSSHIIAHSDKISDEATKHKILRLGEDAITANHQLRQLLFSINPGYDHFENIQAYFREMADTFWNNTHINLHFDMPPSVVNPKMDRIVKSQLTLIYKEILHNIAKHAAASNVSVTFNLTEDKYYFLQVRDDGNGFDSTLSKKFSNGLVNMKSRAAKINATITIQSELHQGTEIRVTGPVDGL